MTEKEKKTDLGTLKINNEVIASIARNAALQVDGVEEIKLPRGRCQLDLTRVPVHG